ncbi:50S ribosomal protein L11 methyltransferase [Henriciella sp.]|jgi:ribosomal protein L11 methyltransferase|uniref:50S ribosomal protein L11 methyltransferase n=1 Tax=Henriciella sp. TaxID=1968823 RepID=UPI0025B857A0|nr:50S ribosomal protein L11 methyltransferase [Henriciella sp.]|tara:strand:+ start:836 stop:1696 length:861 start_codon:yes stop_codon:yes gene_type:complete
MYQISAKGPRAAIEPAWDALAWTDPSPAGAVDAKEDGRHAWRLDAYAESEEDAEACKALIIETSPELNVVIEALEDRDWVTLSLEGLPPVEAGRFIVAGSHVLAKSAPGKTPILIEAGPAFGTGHHGTTLGCLIGLEHVLRRTRPRKVLDIGTGSGLLAIAAIKSGAQRAWGTEIDADSVRVANENAAKNHVANAFQTFETGGGMNATIRSDAPYDLVFANILFRPLVGLAPDIERLTAPGGHVILSGLLNPQEPLVRKAYGDRGLSLTKRVRKDGWSSLVFRKPG